MLTLGFLIVASVTPANGVGLAAGAGVGVVDNIEDKLREEQEFDDVDISTESMVGPLVSVGVRAGDWVDHQLRVSSCPRARR